MPGLVPDAVPEEALDYQEILRRGGANHGDEDFALCRCPKCGRIYLIEYEVDTLYLDPENLSRRVDLFSDPPFFNCENCGHRFPDEPWLGPRAPADMQVTWDQLTASPWRWITERTRAEHIQ
jgi:hypothetical protein